MEYTTWILLGYLGFALLSALIFLVIFRITGNISGISENKNNQTILSFASKIRNFESVIFILILLESTTGNGLIFLSMQNSNEIIGSIIWTGLDIILLCIMLWVLQISDSFYTQNSNSIIPWVVGFFRIPIILLQYFPIISAISLWISLILWILTGILIAIIPIRIIFRDFKEEFRSESNGSIGFGLLIFAEFPCIITILTLLDLIIFQENGLIFAVFGIIILIALGIFNFNSALSKLLVYSKLPQSANMVNGGNR